MKNCKGFLIDIDGVLWEGDKKIEGAAEAIDWLKTNRKILLVTNITRMTRTVFLEKLRCMGFNLSEDDILTPSTLAAEYIQSKKPHAKCFLIAADGIEEDFIKIGLSITKKEDAVDFVVLGFDSRVNYDMLNSAFRLLMNGAEFVAFHEDKMYGGKDDRKLSLGSFVKGLEYSSGKKADIMGKPNPKFFELASKKIGLKYNEMAMIGDSIDIDVSGAKGVGLKTVLVKTGNYTDNDLEKSKIKPDFIIDSIADLPKLVK